MNGFALKEKSSFKLLQLFVTYQLDWNIYITFTAKTTLEIWVLIHFFKVLPEVMVYLYKLTINTCMEYWHAWVGTSNSYLSVSAKSLDRLWKCGLS